VVVPQWFSICRALLLLLLLLARPCAAACLQVVGERYAPQQMAATFHYGNKNQQ
jgi:hypothetical protein